MKLTLALLAVLVAAVHSKYPRKTTPAPTPNPKSVEERVKDMEALVEGLSRQVMLQQFFVEEKTRSDGNSGLKQIRVEKDGTKNYYTPAHTDTRFMAMHDHSNFDRTVGLGELLPVMNGVEFRTRHNDYKLRMPSTENDGYNKMEDIPFPDVPPSVLNKKTVEDQILEMREYFRAFKDQNATHRDYRPYFRSVLCYLEGAWTTGAKSSLDEPFASDRHQIDAASWFDLMDKVRFSSYSGTKSVLENFAFLPTTIINVENGVPHYAQWNYRILCHPLKDNLPTSYLQLEDDLQFRFPQRMKWDKVEFTRGARYRLNSQSIDHFDNGRGLLDKLMYEIPGKNNYGVELHDNSMDMVMEDIHYNNHTLLNTGYYHRYFKTNKKGAMGTKNIHRGFSDANLFVAQTTHHQVAPMSVTNCRRIPGVPGKTCTTWTTRYSYALPLEIIYLTPLFKWNPYDIKLNQDDLYLREQGKRVGQRNLESAYNGTNFKTYYLTPREFFSSGNSAKDVADTSRTGAGILDQNGELRILASSGQRIVTPDIEGIGKIRLRYPIMPIHGEGSGAWKELNALKDMTMRMNRYASLFEDRPGLTVGSKDEADPEFFEHWQVKVTHQDPPGEHGHDIFLNKDEIDELKQGGTVFAITSEDMGHAHDLELFWKNGFVVIRKCDGKPKCWDKHPNRLVRVDV